MVILSGPEPQRTFLEEKLIKEIQSFDGKILFIKGIIESEQKIDQDENVSYYNFKF